MEGPSALWGGGSAHQMFAKVSGAAQQMLMLEPLQLLLCLLDPLQQVLDEALQPGFPADLLLSRFLQEVIKGDNLPAGATGQLLHWDWQAPAVAPAERQMRPCPASVLTPLAHPQPTPDAQLSRTGMGRRRGRGIHDIWQQTSKLCFSPH